MTELASPRRFAYARGALQLFASVAVLGVTLWFVDVEGLVERYKSLHFAWAGVAFCLLSLQFALLAGRWVFIATHIGVPLGYREALSEYYLSSLLNQVLPGGILGDAMRALRHARKLKRSQHLPDAGARAAVALLLDRASGQFAIWLLVLIGFPSWWQGDLAWKVAGTLVFSLATLAVCVRVMWTLLHRFPRVLRFRALLQQASHLLLRPRQIAPHLALSLGLLFLQVLGFWCTAHALGYRLDTASALRIVPGILVASALPAFFAGWGAREAAAATLYHLSGFSAADGATVALLYGSIGLLTSVPGLFVLLGDRLSERRVVDSA